MDTRTQMLDLLKSRQRTMSLPQPFYNDPELYKLDLEHLFYTQWIFAGPSSEIPKAGNYFTFNVGDNPILIVRGRDSTINAFYNVCRHRSSKVCTKEKGNTAKLVCPYHQWTYDLDGKLVFFGDMDADFDPARYPLKRLHCETVGGLIYVSLASGEAPNIESFRRDVEQYMLPHDLANTKVAASSSIVEKGNWKLVIENNRECYHCAGNHPELLNTLAEADNTYDPRIKPEYVEKLARKSKEWDALGLPHSSLNDEGKRYRAVRLPFEHGVSMTMDGKPGCAKLMGSITDPDLGSLRLLSLPNNWNHLQGDHTLCFRVLPISAQESLVTTWWLVHKDAKEGTDYEVDRLTKVWTATNDQDRTLVEQTQLGVNSTVYEPGPYSQRAEFGVQDFIDWYTTEMQSQLTDGPGRLHAVAQ